ncbi:MAG: DUF1501 domain-containing protein [Planctomycetales bacterium]|nr:DUF1501 domain-containing protein [Planctomycetales bacterium]
MANHPAAATRLTRRQWLGRSAGGTLATSLAFGAGASPWFSALAADANAAGAERPFSCILLWMSGGPSQLETLDPKPGKENGGPTQAIATATPGMQLAEHLPKLAQQSKHIALIRSMSTKEGDHQRGTFVAHTGRVPQGPVDYPTLGAFVSHELSPPDDLPPFVSINSQQFFGDYLSSGFLGPEFSPLSVGGNGYVGDNGQVSLSVANLDRQVEQPVFDRRWQLLQAQQESFAADRPDLSVRAQLSASERAKRMMEGRARAAFNLDDEPQALRDSYGATAFGRSCLLARRLVEAGVPFVEVNLNGWDTHNDNFNQCKTLCGQLDAGWATLIDDLSQRGLLERTLVVWMGEFGRTPQINGGNGRDHYPRAWSTALAGAGVPGGAIVGRTSDDGETVEDRPVSAPELIATICARLRLNLKKQNMSNVGRPIRLVDPGVEPVKELLS